MIYTEQSPQPQAGTQLDDGQCLFARLKKIDDRTASAEFTEQTVAQSLGDVEYDAAKKAYVYKLLCQKCVASCTFEDHGGPAGDILLDTYRMNNTDQCALPEMSAWAEASEATMARRQQAATQIALEQLLL